jgi:hypothetical protein
MTNFLAREDNKLRSGFKKADVSSNSTKLKTNPWSSVKIVLP